MREGTEAGEGVTTDPRIERIVALITQKKRIVVPSAEPIDDLAQAVWQGCRAGHDGGRRWRPGRSATTTTSTWSPFHASVRSAPDSSELILEPESVERQS